MGIIQDIHDDLEKGAAQLVAEYRDRLCRDAFALCGDKVEAEDFAFRTFDKVLRKIDTFKGDGSFYDWMKAILVNDIRSAKRTKAARNTVVAEIDADEEPVPDGAPGSEERLMESFDSELVRGAIQKLSPEHREAIVLHYFLDQPIGKMAKLLMIPEGTVKFRLFAARKALAGMLSEQMKRPVVRMLLLFLGLGAFAATAYLGGSVFRTEKKIALQETSVPAKSQDVFDINEGENMIMTRKVASLVGASMLAVASPGSEITSEETFVFLRPETSSFWNTATNSTMSLPIDYPNGSTKAKLEVKGIGYDKVYEGITSDSYELELPVPDSPQTENVYDLKLTFDNEAIVRTAKLGLIQGLSPDSEGATRCLAPAEGSVWNKVKYRAVLPIPYGTTSLSMQTNGGEWKELDTGLNGAQGWYALSPIGRGDNLSLSCIVDGVSYVASLIGGGDGFFVIVK
ncbi:MAG: RNA polymerase sigma factor [Kiritimatiellae bacterium]|nr:RNA polymerase sigma factor [Kiritimatiellia bacterium]